MNYLIRIDMYYDSLSNKEKVIADYIKKNGSNIMYQTLSEVSKLLNVGEATIMRFCQKLQLSGFQELKLEAAKLTQSDIEPIAEGGLINTKTASVISTIQATQHEVSREDLNIVAEHIKRANHLYFFGIANSSLGAQSMEMRLFRLGKIGKSVVDSHLLLISAATVKKGDVIIAFTLTGATSEIYEAIKIAKENEATIIVLTNDSMSPIAKLATITLQTFGAETPLSGGSIEGLFSQMILSELICSVYADNNERFIEQKRVKIADALVKRNIL